MKKIFVCLILILLGALSVNAAEVGIVVDFPDGKVIKNCVEVNDNADGYEVLESADLDISWSSAGVYGHAMCKMEGVGVDTAGTTCAWDASNYWGFFMAENNEWQYMPVGHDAPGDCWDGDFSSYGGHYCAQNGDLIGYRYGEYGDIPRFFSYDEVCGFEISKVSVEPKKPKPGETIKVDVELENNLDFDLRNIELNVWFEDNGKKLEDDDDDVIEDDSRFNLDAGDDESDVDDEDVSFEFEMPYDVDDNDEYSVFVSVEGKQRNDSKIIYRDIDSSKTIKFSREKHEIEIFKFTTDPSKLKYNGEINFDVGLRNLGEKDEDVTLRLFSPDLEIDKTETFELESDADDNEYKNTFYLKGNEDIPGGDYLVTLKAEYNDGNDYETKTVNIHVIEVSKTVINIEDTVEETPQTTVIEKEPVQSQTPSSILNNGNFLVVFVLGLVAVIIFGGLLVAKLIG